MKRFLSIITALLMLLSMTGCSKSEPQDSDFSYIQEKGTLIVGITDYAPMDYRDDNGEWTGFDAEFARIVGERWNVAVEFFELADWDSKYFELNGKNIDCIWNGLTISDEVKKNTDCSNPYVKNAQVVVLPASRANEFQNSESLIGLKFAAEKSSAGAAALEDLGITDYVATTDQATALMEVEAGTVDACVIDLTMANAMTGDGTGYADLTKGPELTSEEYGVAFRKGSDALSEFDKLLIELMNDGTLDALAEKYELVLVKE